MLKVNPYITGILEQYTLLMLKMMVVLSPTIIFFSLPFFRYGLFPKHEPVICGLYGLSSCFTLTLLILCWIRPHTYLALCLHPIVLLFIAFGFWGLICMPFVEVGSVSFFGDPRFGQGIVRYFSIASLLAGNLICLRFKYLRFCCVFMTTVTTLVVIGLHFVANENGIFPRWNINTYQSVDYLAFFGIYNVAILFAAFPKASYSSKLIFVFWGIFIFYYSENRSALFLYIAVTICFGSALYVLRKKKSWLRFAGVIWVTGIPIAITIFTLLLYSNSPMKNSGGELQSGKFYSLYSRALLWSVSFKSIKDNPKCLLFGSGWGTYSSQLIRFATQKNRSLYAENKWDALDRGDWHSHNDFIETLTACGIPGLILWWTILCSLPLLCSKEFIEISVFSAFFLSGLFSLWFQFSAGIPLMVICFSFLLQSKRHLSQIFYKKMFKLMIICMISLIFMIQSYAFAMTLITVVKIDKIKQKFFDTPFEVVEKESKTKLKYFDEKKQPNFKKRIDTFYIAEAAGPGGIHFAILYKMIVENWIEQGHSKPTVSILTFADAYDFILHSDQEKSLLFYLNGLASSNEIARALNIWKRAEPLPLIFKKLERKVNNIFWKKQICVRIWRFPIFYGAFLKMMMKRC